MSQFVSSKRLCCWAGLIPENNESAGKKGVIYPVVISSDNPVALGENNYDFVKLDFAFAAHKTVTISDSKAGFSKLLSDTTATLSVQTRYGRLHY